MVRIAIVGAGGIANRHTEAINAACIIRNTCFLPGGQSYKDFASHVARSSLKSAIMDSSPSAIL